MRAKGLGRTMQRAGARQGDAGHRTLRAVLTFVLMDTVTTRTTKSPVDRKAFVEGV